MSVRGRRLGGWGFGTGGGREAVRLSVYDSLSLRWNVTIGEQDSGLGRVHRDPMHERLHKKGSAKMQLRSKLIKRTYFHSISQLHRINYRSSRVSYVFYIKVRIF